MNDLHLKRLAGARGDRTSETRWGLEPSPRLVLALSLLTGPAFRLPLQTRAFQTASRHPAVRHSPELSAGCPGRRHRTSALPRRLPGPWWHSLRIGRPRPLCLPLSHCRWGSRHCWQSPAPHPAPPVLLPPLCLLDVHPPYRFHARLSPVLRPAVQTSATAGAQAPPWGHAEEGGVGVDELTLPSAELAQGHPRWQTGRPSGLLPPCSPLSDSRALLPALGTHPPWAPPVAPHTLGRPWPAPRPWGQGSATAPTERRGPAPGAEGMTGGVWPGGAGVWN